MNIKMNKKNILELSLAVLALVLVGGMIYWGTVMYKGGSEDGTDTNQQESSEPKASLCEDLVMVTPESLKAPVAHVLESKLKENADADSDICSWSVNGKLAHSSFPVDGKCIFGDYMFEKAGSYKIDLVVEKNDCNITKTIEVK